MMFLLYICARLTSVYSCIINNIAQRERYYIIDNNQLYMMLEMIYIVWVIYICSRAYLGLKQ